MPIDFNCQGCGKHYRVRDEFAGRVAECKNCGQKMTVPKPEAPPEEEIEQQPGGIGFADEEERRPTRSVPQRPAPSREPEPESDYQDEQSSYGESEYDSESDEVGVGAEPDDGPPSLRNFNVKDDAPPPARERHVRNTPLLPDILGETVIPLAGVALGLGGGAFVAG